MGNTDRKLAAHLARRAGFGATQDELDFYESFNYKDLVNHFLDSHSVNHVSDDLIYRRHPNIHAQLTHNPMYWAYRMLTTNSPMQEKIALFWHGIFATAEPKINNFGAINNQINMFRDKGLSKFDEILIELSKDPAMIVWLDNQTNHKNEINENYGREILELFSMGVGNYTEQDVKECARAFTGWTIGNSEYMALMGAKDSIWPYGRIFWHFEYDEKDHDNGVKTFLGETGRFNGEDVIRIICKQEATAQFVARHLYNYFVADEVPVPQWGHVPPKDPSAIDDLVEAYRQSEYSIKEILRVLFNSDFFKSDEARFARIKSPAELVTGMLRMAGGLHVASYETYEAADACSFMGQELLSPPSVEGWQGGDEWINTGTYVERVNYASKMFDDTGRPGIRSLIDRVKGSAISGALTSYQLVDTCLEILGPIPASENTRKGLLSRADTETKLTFDTDEAVAESEKKIVTMLQLVASTQEFQLA